MSLPNEREIAMLLAAYGNRELTTVETERVRTLAAQDAQVRAELAGIDAVHEAFADERALCAEVAEPVRGAEAIDEGFQRISRAAARAEGELRARLLHPQPDAAVSPLRRVRRASWLAAVAAIVAAAVGLWFLLAGDVDRPGLIDRRPGTPTLGAPAKILIEAELVASRPELSWHAVLGASGYDAVIEDVDGRALLRRPVEASRSTHWSLSAEQFAPLLDRAAGGASLVLRITARDGAGTVVGSSGDLPLRLVD